MVLVGGTDEQLWEYNIRPSDVSTEPTPKYMKVLSIIDVKYQEYQDWKTVSTFYESKEDLQAARVNHNSGLLKASINRSYFVIFHSI